jgi:regulator of CtrA degradation
VSLIKKQSSVSGPVPAVMLSFRDRFTASPQFHALFREGMALVEKAADYLDSQGRRDAKTLKAPARLAYNNETMRLTTRLLQIASWLLLKRAVANGEITPEDVRNHKRRVRLIPQSASHPDGFAELPETLKSLIAASHALHERILRLDRLMGDGEVDWPAPPSPVGHQIERIRLSFPAA